MAIRVLPPGDEDLAYLRGFSIDLDGLIGTALNHQDKTGLVRPLSVRRLPECAITVNPRLLKISDQPFFQFA